MGDNTNNNMEDNMSKQYKHWEVAFVVTKVIRTEVTPESADGEAETARKHEAALAVQATEFHLELADNLSAIGVAADDVYEVGVKEVK